MWQQEFTWFFALLRLRLLLTRGIIVTYGCFSACSCCKRSRVIGMT